MIRNILSHKRFIKLLKDTTIKFKKELIILILGVFVVTIINIFIPYLGGEVTELFIKKELNTKIILFGISIYIVKLCIQYSVSYNTNYLSGILSLNLKSELIDKYVLSKTVNFDSIRSGDFHQRVFNEVGLLQGKLIFGTIHFFKDIVFFALLIINIYIISPLLFISLIVFTTVIYFFNVRVSGKVSDINSNRQFENAKLSNFFLEIVHGKDDILFFNLFSKIQLILLDRVGKIKKYIRLNSIFQGLSDVFLEIIVLLFIFTLIIILLQENRSTGDIITAVGFVIFLLWPLKGINTYLISLSVVLPSVNRIEEVLERMEITNVEYRNRKILIKEDVVSLSLEGVSFSYDDKEIFSKFSFLFNHGVFLVRGKNGAGKSTLAKILIGTLSPNEGHINITVPDSTSIFGIVSQTPFLYNSSIKENLKINKNISDEKINALFSEFELDQDFNIDLNKIVGENGQNLSGGEKQIISIFRGLLANPYILILDEITNNLRQEFCENLIQKIISKRKNKITIIISHNKIRSIKFDGVIKI